MDPAGGGDTGFADGGGPEAVTARQVKIPGDAAYAAGKTLRQLRHIAARQLPSHAYEHP